MTLVFSNLAGFWALLGIPAVLAIHFLQRKAKVLPVATLFLLEQTQRESAGGRRWERLVGSVPLWMQLLAVLLLTWLLVEPRYQKPRSVQRIAVVLDASASMEVIREALADRLAAELPRLVGPAVEAEFTLFDSLPGGPRLYAGSSSEEMLTALGAWRPRAGVTDPTQALRLARSLVSRDGIVVYATDTPRSSLPFDALLLAVGDPLDNVGFTGVSFENRDDTLVWQAIVRNYSDRAATRTWSVAAADGSRTEPAVVELEPRGFTRLQSAFPGGAERIEVVLEADDFRLDDSLPLVRPRAKPLRLHVAGETAGLGDLTSRIAKFSDEIQLDPDPAEADIQLLSCPPGNPSLPPGNAIVFVHDEAPDRRNLKGGIVAEAHPLTERLNWQPLEVRETQPLQQIPSDQVLLWQGTRPLIVLRGTLAGDPPRHCRQLLFNFTPAGSNVLQLPAFAVLIHRFCEDLRSAKIAPESKVLECGQPITLAADPAGPPLETLSMGLGGTPDDASSTGPTALLRATAPRDPCFLQIRQGNRALLDAAVHFGDTREADFSACGQADNLDSATTATIQRHTREDHWWRAWLLALLLALLLAWHYTKTARSSKLEGPSAKMGELRQEGSK